MIKDIFSQSKTGSQRDNEDSYYLGSTLVGVFDGSTSKSFKRIHGITTGAIASNLAADTLRSFDGKKFEFENYLNLLTGEIATFTEENDIVDPVDFPRVSVVVLDLQENKVYSYGDCQILINNVLKSEPKRIDTYLSHLRAGFLEALIMNGTVLDVAAIASGDPGRSFIFPLLKNQYIFENKSVFLGYPVLNGVSYNNSMISIWECEPGDNVVLATDGYIKVFPTFQESEQYLFNYIRRDPLLIDVHKSTKGVISRNISFDDRTYCRLSIEKK